MADKTIPETAEDCKHTLGPWYSNLTGHAVWSRDTGQWVCDTWPAKSAYPTENAKHNARLIAAAPEMLEALKACDKLIFTDERLGNLGHLQDQVMNAIAKAKGESE